MSITGIWQLHIVTPIGTQLVLLELSEQGGALAGVARGTTETIPLIDLKREGDRLTWKQSITRPMRLHLVFDVTIQGSTMIGTSKAGMLPTSKVTGSRVTTDTP